MFKILTNKKGVALIEVIVVVVIFSVTVLAVADIFKWVVEGQRNALAAQNVQENMRFAFEAMGKEIRMAQKSDTSCYAGGIYKVYNTSGGNTKLWFRNKNGNCTSYDLNNNAITVDRVGILGSPYAITPNEIKISNLTFSVTDDLINALHSVQPRVTMAMDVEAVGKIIHLQKMRLQFTISSRYYE